MTRLSKEQLPAAAAGAILLTLALQVTIARFGDDWDAGVRFAILLAGAAAVLALLFSTAKAGAIGAGETALLVAGLLLVFGALVELSDFLGGDTNSSGTLTWVGAVFAGFAGWLAWQYRSPVAALFLAVAAGVTVLSFVDWVFSPNGVTTFRYVLLGLTIVLVAAAFAKRSDSKRHAAQFGIAAALAALGVVGTFALGFLFGFLPFGDEGGGDTLDIATGWEVYFFLTGAVLLALAMLDSEPGLAYAGGAVLFAFASFAAMPDRDGPSLIGWPIVLLVSAVALLGYAVAGSRRE